MDEHERDRGTHARCPPNWKFDKKSKKLHKSYERVNYERWQAHYLTSDQVHGHSTSNVVRKRLVRVCFKTFLKTSILEKLLSGTDLQVKFHNFTMLALLKYETWNAEVLQIGVFKFKGITKPSTAMSYKRNEAMYI